MVEELALLWTTFGGGLEVVGRLVMRGLSVILTLQPKFLNRVRSLKSFRVCSKEGSPPTCSSFPCATYDPPLLCLLSGEQRYFFVFSGLCWRHRCWSPSPPFFKSLTQTFCLYCYMYFVPLVFTYWCYRYFTPASITVYQFLWSVIIWGRPYHLWVAGIFYRNNNITMNNTKPIFYLISL